MQSQLLEVLAKENPRIKRQRIRSRKPKIPPKPKLTVNDGKIRYTGDAIEFEVLYTYELITLIFRIFFE